jgi:hypothetical protein
LGPTVDHVDFMERHSMHDFFPFLDLTLGTLNKFCLLHINMETAEFSQEIRTSAPIAS